MARCPECNKFVSFGEEPFVEIEDYNYDDGIVNIQTNITLECDDCGMSLKEATLEYSEAHHCKFCSDDEFDPDAIEITEVEEEGYMRLDDHNGKRKKPITLFGCSFKIILSCSRCNQKTVIEAHVEAEPKEFDEC